MSKVQKFVSFVVIALLAVVSLSVASPVLAWHVTAHIVSTCDGWTVVKTDVYSPQTLVTTGKTSGGWGGGTSVSVDVTWSWTNSNEKVHFTGTAHKPADCDERRPTDPATKPATKPATMPATKPAVTKTPPPPAEVPPAFCTTGYKPDSLPNGASVRFVDVSSGAQLGPVGTVIDHKIDYVFYSAETGPGDHQAWKQYLGKSIRVEVAGQPAFFWVVGTNPDGTFKCTWVAPVTPTDPQYCPNGKPLEWGIGYQSADSKLVVNMGCDPYGVATLKDGTVLWSGNLPQGKTYFTVHGSGTVYFTVHGVTKTVDVSAGTGKVSLQ